MRRSRYGRRPCPHGCGAWVTTNALGRAAHSCAAFRARVEHEREAERREKAVRYAVSVLRRAHDWQEAEHALADHPSLGPWLVASGDPIASAQSIIRAAEKRLEGRR